MSSRLTQWLDHRMDVVGIEHRKDLSEQTGIAASSLRELREIGTLEILNRTQKHSLAIALRVSLRKLERIDANSIDWIDDSHVYDADGYSRLLPSRESDPTYWAPQEPAREQRGTPLIGRIRPTGQVELDEDWDPEWGRYIPLRFGKDKVFALEFEPTETAVVLQRVPVWEFRGGKAAVYCWNGWEAEAWFGYANLEPKSYITTPAGQRRDLNPTSIVCIGKIVACWLDQSRVHACCQTADLGMHRPPRLPAIRGKPHHAPSP